jgi:RNA polymerase sigma-70 factor (ECF subfamily)
VVAAYHQHAAGLLRYATSLARNGDQARDAVQEVFLRYFVERNYGRQIDNPRAWLYQVLRNHLLSRLQTASSQREVASDDIEREPDQRCDPETLLQRNQTAREIAATLSDRELDCLRLRAEGLSYDEIAETMSIRAGTVGALLTRVHKKLRLSHGDSAATLGTAEAVRFLFQEADSYLA